MSVSVSISGNVSLVDSVSGSVAFQKALTLAFSGTFSEIVQSQNIGAAPVSLTLPGSPAQFVYVKNLHATQTVTVTWTPTGGVSAVVCTLQPGAYIILGETNTTSGITALSVTASGTSTPVEYLLVA